jgi:hypothetical protein
VDGARADHGVAIAGLAKSNQQIYLKKMKLFTK